jgi:hypothetical protein
LEPGGKSINGFAVVANRLSFLRIAMGSLIRVRGRVADD